MTPDDLDAVRAARRYTDLDITDAVQMWRRGEPKWYVSAADFDHLFSHLDEQAKRIEMLEGALRWAVGTEDLRDWAIYASKEVAVTIEGIANDIARAALAAAKDKP